MDGITLRPCLPAEWQALQTFGREVFFHTFRAFNTPENMTAYLETAFSDQQVQAELNNPDSAFWLALDGERIVGYLKTNTGPAQHDLQDAGGIEIERIYVDPAFMGRGLAALLLDKAKALARAQQAPFIWLGVWEHNPRAIRFYEKSGFRVFGQHTFMLGDDAQTDLLMRLDLP